MSGGYKSHLTRKALCVAPLVTGAVEWVRAGGGGRFAGEGRGKDGISSAQPAVNFGVRRLTVSSSLWGAAGGQRRGRGESLKFGMIERP